MVQSLPGFLNLSLNVCSPCQVLGDVYTEVLEAAHPLHRGPTDHKRSVLIRPDQGLKNPSITFVILQ